MADTHRAMNETQKTFTKQSIAILAKRPHHYRSHEAHQLDETNKQVVSFTDQMKTSTRAHKFQNRGSLAKPGSTHPLEHSPAGITKCGTIPDGETVDIYFYQRSDSAGGGFSLGNYRRIGDQSEKRAPRRIQMI